MTQAMSKTGKCKLCKRYQVLLESHVIPRFVRRGARLSGAVEDPRYYTGEGGKFLKLEQDLPKKAWLCQECEQLLSRSERRFAEAVYQGIWMGRAGSDGPYEEHVHRFLVSMAWRTWHWYDERKDNPFSKVSNEDRFREAEDVWRCYLLGKRSDVGEFKQHILVQSGQVSDPAGRALGLHGYYWDRGVNLDILRDGGSEDSVLMVYSKIPKIAMFGIVEPKRSGYWRGTLVEPSLGNTWSRQKATVPGPLIQYMREQSQKTIEILNGAPEAVKRKTRQRMETLVEHEGDDYLERDAVRSLVADDLMELPEESIVSDALSRAVNNSDARVRRIGELLSRLSEAEMRSLHQETNRIGIRCKALNVEERFSLLADGKEEAREPGKAILVGVEVFRTRERAMERSSLPLIFGLNTEEVTVAIGAEILTVPEGSAERGIRYLR